MLNLKKKIIKILSSRSGAKSPEAEANLILYHFFRDQTRSPEKCIVTFAIETEATRIASERAQGTPLQHLLGYQFFYEHEYKVNPHVLIPRPETEILVSTAIDWAKKNHAKKFAELGIGSGILSCELLAALKDLHGYASESSREARLVAAENLEKIIGQSWGNRLKIMSPRESQQGFEVFLNHAPYDFIISNPPYVSPDDEIEKEVIDHEPHGALFPAPGTGTIDPNFFYKNFILHSKTLLVPGGAAFFEIPHERAESIAALFKDVEIIPDLTGRPRVLKCIF